MAMVLLYCVPELVPPARWWSSGKERYSSAVRESAWSIAVRQQTSKLGDSSSNQLEPSWHHHIKKYQLYTYHEHSRLHQKGTNANSLNSSHQGNLSLLSSYWPYLEAYHCYWVGQWQTCIHNLSWFYHDLYILSSISRWEPKLFKCTNMKQGNEKKKTSQWKFFFRAGVWSGILFGLLNLLPT